MHHSLDTVKERTKITCSINICFFFKKVSQRCSRVLLTLKLAENKRKHEKWDLNYQYLQLLKLDPVTILSMILSNFLEVVFKDNPGYLPQCPGSMQVILESLLIFDNDKRLRIYFGICISALDVNVYWILAGDKFRTCYLPNLKRKRSEQILVYRIKFLPFLKHKSL